MTIRMGDVFRDGEVHLHVYGFKESSEAVDGRQILVATKSGEKSAVDPWELMENCILIPTDKPDANVVFDSEKHGKPLLN